MARRLSIEFIRENVKQRGSVLLSEKYINSKTKLTIKCPHGHVYKTIWNVWQRCFKCSDCSNNKKKKFEEVEKLFEKENCVLLSKEYKSNKQKLKYICSNGKKHETRLNDWLNNHRCSCFVKNTKKTFKEVKASFETEGYTLISKQYRNCNQKLKYICPKKHAHQIIFAEWNSGRRCPYCRGKAKPTIEYIRKQFKTEGYVLFENEYKNNRQKLHYKCPNGHYGTIEHMSWQQGCRCNRCGYDNMMGENGSNWKNYTPEDLIKKEGYRAAVNQITDLNYIKYFYFINPRKLPRSNRYHLDHIFSVLHGYENNIHPKVISSPVNLRIITRFENVSKNGNSFYTKEELFDLCEQFNREIKKGFYNDFSV